MAYDGNPQPGTVAHLERETRGLQLWFGERTYVWHLKPTDFGLESEPGVHPALSLTASGDGKSLSFLFRKDGREITKWAILRRSSEAPDPPRVVVGHDSTQQLLVFGGERRALRTARAKVALGLGAVRAEEISEGELARIPEGDPIPDQPVYVVKGAGVQQYLVVQGWRRWIRDPETKRALGLDRYYAEVSEDKLEEFPETVPFPRLTRRPKTAEEAGWGSAEAELVLARPNRETRRRIREMGRELRSGPER
jgi:hypothetical protein